MKVRSISTTKKWLKKLKIKKSCFDRYRCVSCYKGQEAFVRRTTGRPLPGDENIMNDHIEHVHLYKHQFAEYKKQKNELNTDEILIVLDYTTIHETAIFKMKICGFCIYYKENEELKHYFIDFCCKNGKHNSNFTKCCWEKIYQVLLTKEINLKEKKKLIVWSDGGLKGHDNVNTFNIFSKEHNILLESNYFGPCHGHSVCDGHFGVSKKKIRLTFASDSTRILTPEDITNVIKELKNTTVIVLDSIPEFTEKSKKNAGIRKWFCIKLFPLGNLIHAFDKTGGDLIGKFEVNSIEHNNQNPTIQRNGLRLTFNINNINNT